MITNYKLVLTGELTEENANAFLYYTRPFQAIFVFLLARKLFENKKVPAILEKAITFTGGCVFGIYLIEQAFRDGLYSIYYAICSRINSFIAIWIYVLIIFLICQLPVAAFKFAAGIIRKNINTKT